MAKQRIKLMSTVQILLIASLVLLTVLMVIFQGIRSRQEFTQMAEKIQADYIASQKAMIKREVLQVVDRINYHRSLGERQIQDSVQQRVYEAHAVAEHIYQRHKDSKTAHEVETLIADALQPIRFNQGSGYYFITHLDGREILFADRPTMAGQDLLQARDAIRDMVAIAEKSGEGFYESLFSKAGSGTDKYKKIFFIKRFEPYDWLIGAGLDTEAAEQQIKSALLHEISNIRFGEEGYVFVNHLNGDALVSNGQLFSGSKKLWQVFDKNSEDMKEIFHKEYAAALKPGGDYIYYRFQKLSDSRADSPKTSYIYGIPDWNWLIGAGVYLDDVDADIAELQSALNRDLRGEIKMTALTFSITLIILLAVFQWISGRYFNDFSLFATFFEQAAADDKEIDCRLVRFAELHRMAEHANRMLRDKRTAKQNLQEEKERFKELTEYLPVGVFEADLDLRLTYVNQKGLALFGYSGEDLERGLNGLGMFIPEDREKVRSNIAKRMQSEHTEMNEYIGLKKDGSTVPVISHSSLVHKDGAVVGIRGFIADIGERKLREEEQLKLKKLESVGVLAGGIAHDFNNLLAGLFGNIEMAKRSLDAEHKASRFLRAAGQSMENATNLTQQLLTFAKGGAPIKETIAIGDVLIEAAQFSLRGSNVKLQAEIAADLYPVDADKGQLNQVISNLVINARQAMPAGGTLTLKAENLEGPDGAGVLISIEDQGTGIAPQYLDKVFDPYFTTKQQGSGLGLATCYSIVNKHNGRITVNSELNRGTRFTIYFPAASTAGNRLPGARQEPVGGSIPRSKSAHILLMDDEESIREVCGAMLKDMGHQVTYAVAGEDALEKYRAALAGGRAFDLVISDLTIPGGMGGQELIKEILKLDPAARTIVSSGYATDPVMANYRQHGFWGRVVKPYRFADLEQVIESVYG